MFIGDRYIMSWNNSCSYLIIIYSFILIERVLRFFYFWVLGEACIDTNLTTEIEIIISVDLDLIE